MPRKATMKGGNPFDVVGVLKDKSWMPYMLLWTGMAFFVIIILAVVSVSQSKQQEVRVVVIDKAQQIPSHTVVSKPSSEPPIYPQKNPAYPLRGVEQEFQQIGVLVSQDANEDQPILLPLFGRKMASRDRWEYYIASDKYHMWKLPVQFKNRMCEDDVGCDEIYQGDEVVVPDYANKVFTARIYKYDTPKYRA